MKNNHSLRQLQDLMEKNYYPGANPSNYRLVRKSFHDILQNLQKKPGS